MNLASSIEVRVGIRGYEISYPFNGETLFYFFTTLNETLDYI